MITKEDVYTSLFHGDFSTANHLATVAHPEELTDDMRELVTVLARQFGDVGLISGDMGVIINYALNSIGVFDDEAPDLKIVR